MIKKSFCKRKPGCRVEFCIGDSRLDLIALQIIREKNKKLWKNFVVKKYPSFALIQNRTFKIEKKLVERIYIEKQAQFIKSRQNFRRWWFFVENRWFSFLEKFFELNKVINDIVFTAHIGISPIFPRDVEDESFLVPFYANRNELLRLCAHETSHFYFFRKLKEINPLASKKEILQSRHFWLVSEILVPLIFGDPQSVKILGMMPQKSYVCQPSLIERYHSLYQMRSKGQIGFQQFFREFCQIEIEKNELNLKFFQ